MEPVISPWLIYWIGVIKNFQAVIFVLVAFSVLGFVVSVPSVDQEDCDENKGRRRIMKICAIVFILGVILLIFIPDKDTMMTMLALQYITPDNIQAVQGNIVEFVTNIAKAVKNIK